MQYSKGVRNRNLSFLAASKASQPLLTDVDGATILEDPRVLTDHESLVVVTGLGDSSVDLMVAPWCKPEDY